MARVIEIIHTAALPTVDHAIIILETIPLLKHELYNYIPVLRMKKAKFSSQLPIPRTRDQASDYKGYALVNCVTDLTKVK